MKAAISYHGPHQHFAHKLYAYLRMRLPADEIFFAEATSDPQHVHERLRTVFKEARIIVVLLSNAHLHGSDFCGAEWREFLTRFHSTDKSTWDVTNVNCDPPPPDVAPKSIRVRTVRMIADAVFDKLNVAEPSHPGGDLSTQILSRHKVEQHRPGTCCLVTAGTLERIHDKASRRIAVAKQLGTITREAIQSAVDPRRPGSRFWPAVLALLDIFAMPKETFSGPYFYESFAVVRLETFLKKTLTAALFGDIERLCDGLADTAAQRRNGVRFDPRTVDVVLMTAEQLAFDLMTLPSLSRVTVPAGANVRGILNEYRTALTQDHRLLRTRLQ